MKKVTFDKPIKSGEFRIGVPGYAFTHPKHPGRTFVVARGTVTRRGQEGYTLAKSWHCYDLASGHALKRSKGRTRTEAVSAAITHLHELTPEEVVALIKACDLLFLTARVGAPAHNTGK